MKTHAILFFLFLTIVVGLSLTMASAPPAAAAVGTTYTVTSTSCTGPGSITEAIALANANPGQDTIELTPKLQIFAGDCPAVGEIQPSDFVIAEVTDSLIIEGNDGALIGKMNWFNAGGRQSFTHCPTRTPGTLIVATMPGFLRIGEGGQDNTGLQVTMKNLRVKEFNQAAQVRENASLVMENVYLEDIYSWRYCSDPAIDAHEGASVTLQQTTFDNYVSFQDDFVFETPAVSGGVDAGDLTIENSQFFKINADFPQPTIWWHGAPGSQVDIVSTLFGDTGSTDTFSAENGGIHVLGSAVTNIVNSLWNNDIDNAPDPGDIIWNDSSGDMNIIASTLIWNSDDCDTGCQQAGIEPAFFYRSGTGRINFEQSAIGINFLSTISPSLLTLRDAQTNGFTADADTWIQPTQRQDAAALRAITGQPALRTDSPAFDVPQFSSVAALGTPSVGTTGNPGQLIDVIPDANCGNSNELLNPIDNSCIDKDVLGNSRWDTGNSKRNIGGVQLTLAPHLTVNNTGVVTVDLVWTKPQTPSGSTITGYELRYSEKDAGSWTSISITGPDTLAHQVTGLTNGTEYEFEVRATYSPSGTGPYSNNVTATPLGPIGAPVVTATPGNTQVDLSWTKPSDGGHEIDIYTILWRPTGTLSWIGATAVQAPSTQTTITGLTNGTEYEFAVTATAVDGAYGPQGTATATPVAPDTITYLPVIAALWPEIKPPPESCGNIAGNSGFEDNSSWVLETTEYTAAYTTSKHHTGARSVRTGITNESSNIFSYSSAMQTVTIADDATKAELRYYIYPQTTETMAFKAPARALEIMEDQSHSASDVQLVLILDLNNNELARLYGERRNDRTWLLGTHDLMNFKGQTIKLYFGTFNNGRSNQGVTAVYVDDVSLEVCAPN